MKIDLTCAHIVPSLIYLDGTKAKDGKPSSPSNFSCFKFEKVRHIFAILSASVNGCVRPPAGVWLVYLTKVVESDSVDQILSSHFG